MDNLKPAGLDLAAIENRWDHLPNHERELLNRDLPMLLFEVRRLREIVAAAREYQRAEKALPDLNVEEDDPAAWDRWEQTEKALFAALDALAAAAPHVAPEGTQDGVGGRGEQS